MRHATLPTALCVSCPPRHHQSVVSARGGPAARAGRTAVQATGKAFLVDAISQKVLYIINSFLQDFLILPNRYDLQKITHFQRAEVWSGVNGFNRENMTSL